MYLLDTHTLIWYLEGDNNLSIEAKNSIDNSLNACYISAASLWEIAIKLSLKNRIIVNKDFEDIKTHLTDNKISLLPIEIEHVKIVRNLEYHHKDPFDRIIISQALQENFVVITKDPLFKLYNVKLLW